MWRPAGHWGSSCPSSHPHLRAHRAISHTCYRQWHIFHWGLVHDQELKSVELVYWKGNDQLHLCWPSSPPNGYIHSTPTRTRQGNEPLVQQSKRWFVPGLSGCSGQNHYTFANHHIPWVLRSVFSLKYLFTNHCQNLHVWRNEQANKQSKQTKTQSQTNQTKNPTISKWEMFKFSPCDIGWQLQGCAAAVTLLRRFTFLLIEKCCVLYY